MDAVKKYIAVTVVYQRLYCVIISLLPKNSLAVQAGETDDTVIETHWPFRQERQMTLS
jgi:hypothetical protein